MYDSISNSVNGLAVQSAHLLNEKGEVQNTPKGDCLTYPHFLAKLTNSKNRYLSLKGRTSSVYAAIAETLWVCSGSAKINPWLTKFLKRAPIYSDDGEYWTCGYGPRLYEYDQLGGVIQLLLDNPDTRHAVLSLYDPEKESYQGMLNKFGTTKLKDKTCNLTLLFKQNSNKQLELTIQNRSNDWCFGIWSINAFEFTFIQEIVAEYLNAQQKTYLNEEDGSIERPTPIVAGDYIVFSNNYHSYRASNQKQAGNDTAQKQFEAVLENYGKEYSDTLPDCQLKMDLGTLARVEPHLIGIKLRTFFTGLINLLSKELLGREEVHQYLEGYKISKGSTLWAYSLALYGYLFGQSISEEDCGNDEHFLHVLRNSKFTKFEIIPEAVMHSVSNDEE